MCQGENHSKKLISLFLVPWLQKLWGSACNSSSKLLNTFYIKSIRDYWRAVSSRSFPRYFHRFLTCTRLRRNHRVLACSEEHNPGDDRGSNTTSLEMKKRDEAFFWWELCQKNSGNRRKETENERNEYHESMRTNQFVGWSRSRISFQGSKQAVWLWVWWAWVLHWLHWLHVATWRPYENRTLVFYGAEATWLTSPHSRHISDQVTAGDSKAHANWNIQSSSPWKAQSRDILWILMISWIT